MKKLWRMAEDLLARPSVVRRLSASLPLESARLRRVARSNPPPPGGAFVRASDWLPPKMLAILCDEERKRPHDGVGDGVVLGRIDNDGRLLCPAGELPNFDPVGSEEFVERYRYDLDLVLLDDSILIRKDYRGDRPAFLREWASLARLGGRSAPAVHHADDRRAVLFKAFLPGPTLRQRLADAGAEILSVDTEDDPELASLEAAARIEAVWARGREKLQAAGLEDVAERLRQALDSAHRRGLTGFSLTFGNVVLQGDAPHFIDFDDARVHRRAAGPIFAGSRRRDRELLRRIYVG